MRTSDKTRIIIAVICGLLTLVAITASLKIITDTNIRITEIKELKK